MSLLFWQECNETEGKLESMRKEATEQLSYYF